MKTKVVRIGFVALLAAGPVAMATAGTSAASTTTYTGKATFHPEGINACGGVSHDSDLSAAVSSQMFGNAPSPLCGSKIAITYKGKTITVTVDDSNPWLGPNDLDLSPSAFIALASTDAGMVDVTWRFVKGGPKPAPKPTPSKPTPGKPAPGKPTPNKPTPSPITTTRRPAPTPSPITTITHKPTPGPITTTRRATH